MSCYKYTYICMRNPQYLCKCNNSERRQSRDKIDGEKGGKFYAQNTNAKTPLTDRCMLGEAYAKGKVANTSAKCMCTSEKWLMPARKVWNAKQRRKL